MFHTADPTAFFEPIDAENERYEELAAHPDWGFLLRAGFKTRPCLSSATA